MKVKDLLQVCGSATLFTVLDENESYLGSYGLFERLRQEHGDMEVVTIWPACKDVLEVTVRRWKHD